MAYNSAREWGNAGKRYVMIGTASDIIPESFSAREIQIIGLMSKGLSNAAIAQQLYLSLETIKWYNKQIFSKLEVNNRTQAIIQAGKYGLLDTPYPAQKHNLPRQITRFIGRGAEVRQVKIYLEKASLVTLTGSGGVGKSRLSIQVAGEVVENYPDGIWFVELAPILDPELLPQAIIRALGLAEESQRTINDVLMAYLRPKRVLLVLDNCEHLLDACAQLAENLLSKCPRLSLLVTSREALGLPGEVVYRLPSLQVPEQPLINLEEFQTIEAVQLFLERARDVFLSFEVTEGNQLAIAEICRRLDGIPLALELAAARMNVLTPHELTSRLDHAFSVLHGRRPASLPRHQTLQAAIEWSYQLLSQAERRLLRSLSVFTGGWILEAAEAVCKDERLQLASLVNKSLVVAVQSEQHDTRYHLLETIRQFAWEKLEEAGEAELLCDRHLAYFADWAEQTSLKLKTIDQRLALRRLEAEHENMQASLHWALEIAVPARGGDGLRLACALIDYWILSTNVPMGSFWLEKLLNLIVPDTPYWGPYRAKVLLFAAANRSFPPYLHEAQRAWVNESISISRNCGYFTGESKGIAALADITSWVDYASASSQYDEAIRVARQSSDRWDLAWMLLWTGMAANEGHDWVKARALLEESQALFSEVGDQWNKTRALVVLSEIVILQGDLRNGRQLAQEVTHRYLQEPEILIEFSSYLVQNAYYLDDYNQMEMLMEVSIDTARKMGKVLTLVYYQRIAGVIARARGELQHAAQLFQEALLSAQKLDDKYGVYAAIGRLAGMALDSGQPELAAQLLAAAYMYGDSLSRSTQIDSFDRDQFKRDADTAKQQLGEAAFAEAWSAGCGFSVEMAIRVSQTIFTMVE